MSKGQKECTDYCDQY